MEKSSVKVFCTSDHTAKLTSAMSQLLLPLSLPARIEMFVNNLNILHQITALQVDDEVLVKLDHYNIIPKAIIKYKGSLPDSKGNYLKGDYFGVELLVSYYGDMCNMCKNNGYIHVLWLRFTIVFE